MSATLAHLCPQFDDLIQTPADVQRLNEAILQLAVQGKLVPQDPTNEPASELLARIEMERERLVNGRHSKQVEAVPSSGKDKVPFAIPSVWKWVSLGDLCHLITDGTHKTPIYTSVGIPFISVNNFRENKISFENCKLISREEHEQLVSRCKPELGDILLGKVGSIGVCDVVETNEEFSIFVQIALLKSYQPFVNSYYLRYAILSKFVQNQIFASSSGTALQYISLTKIRQLIIPLPPLAEQKRIVAKVDELLAQTRTLEAKLRRAAEAIVVVNRAVLHRVQSAPDPATFQHAWATLRDHFDDLTTDPRTLTDLRQTILQLAVQGKLVPQDPHDEPASALLQQIPVEKNRRLTKENQASADALPFDLPRGWTLVSLGDVIDLISGQHIMQADYNTENEGVPYLTGPADFGELYPVITKWTTKPKVTAQNEDILITVKGAGLGKLNIVNLPEVAISRQLMAIRSLWAINDYIYLFLRSEFHTFQDSGVGIAIPGLSREHINRLSFPLPPLAEQKRIVAKVDELLARCDALAAKLGAAQVAAGQLTAAVLAQAVG